MPRENSFSDEGASLTSEDEDYPAAVSPTYDGEPRSFARGAAPQAGAALPLRSPSKYTVKSSPSSRRTPLRPIQRFRAAARKVIAMHRGTNMIRGRGVGSEPGIDPRRATADVQYGGIHQDCVIELFDYSGWSLSAGRMTNKEFVDLMGDEQASERDAWVKVRWINISGISWDVIKAVSLAYGACCALSRPTATDSAQTCIPSRSKMFSINAAGTVQRPTTTLVTSSSAYSVMSLVMRTIPSTPPPHLHTAAPSGDASPRCRWTTSESRTRWSGKVQAKTQRRRRCMAQHHRRSLADGERGVGVR